MLNNIKEQLQSYLHETLKNCLPTSDALPEIELEKPAEKQHGDFACNIALKSAKILKRPPIEIAKEFVRSIESNLPASVLKDKIEKVEVKNPGFINFFLTTGSVCDVLHEVLDQKNNYGASVFGQKEKIQIEFVSANPTGPLSVAHARQAAVGDALGNILKFLGFDVTKEYYVNDGGNQINILGQSIRLRGLELLGEKIEFPENAYQGDYIKDMAKEFMAERSIRTPKDWDKISAQEVSQYGATYLLAVIKNELDDFNVHFDVWSYESKIATKEMIEKMLNLLTERGFIYEKDGARWFKSTQFGDDKDRVVQKSDGSYTYLTPDIVYHKNKFERGFSRVFNIWGPDHHGYIPRIKAAAQALGKKKDSIEVLIVQLATIFRGGEALSMSTRRGQYISLREVMDEVGVDAARYFFMMRHIKNHLEFDLELAKKQSSENPVYYIQYGHARMHSINKKAKDAGISMKAGSLTLLSNEEEMDLIKKIGRYQEALMQCYQQLDPYPLVNYLHELAMCFHKFYDVHRVIDENKDLSAERLVLVNAAGIVLANGLKLLGLNAPQSM